MMKFDIHVDNKEQEGYFQGWEKALNVQTFVHLLL